MMHSRIVLAALLLCLSLPAAADTMEISDIQVIDLQPGINDIPHLTSDGRDGQIIKAQRTDGNANGYHIFVVMIGGKLVGVATSSKFEDVIWDQPHTSADAVKSVRFARARVAGENQMLLITATRQLRPQDGTETAAPVLFDIYELVPNGPIGTTGDYFTRIKEFPTKKKYCNADLALNHDMGLPLPDPFQGQNQTDGCL